MRRFTIQCIALLLTALWLPAMQHCALDSLGLLEAHVITHDHDGCEHHTDTPQHAQDTCVLIESSAWLDTAEHLAAPAPTAAPAPVNALPKPGALPAILSALRPFSPSALSSPPPHAREHPQNRIPARHFANHEAPPARAPDTRQA